MKTFIRSIFEVVGFWLLVLGTALVICIFVASCSKSNVNPSDPNAKFYGTWVSSVTSAEYQGLYYSAPPKMINWSKSTFDYKVLKDSLLGVSRHYYYELTSVDLVLRWKSNDSSYTYLFNKSK